MKKAMAVDILKFFSENGKKDFADSFQELCIDCGIFMANDKIAQHEVEVKKTVAKIERDSREKVIKALKVQAKKTVAMARTLDFFKFVSTDKTREYMGGVYHDKGSKIATDGRIMVIAKSDYDSKFENVILSKSLVPVEGQYPNYRRVIPDFPKMQRAHDDFSGIKDNLKKADSIMRIYKKLTNAYIFCTLSNGAKISVDCMKKILHFVECYPESELYVHSDNNKACALVQGSPENPEAMCIFMPLANDWHVSCSFNNVCFQSDCSRYSEYDILKYCKKSDILQRKEFGTMTEKDVAFLESVHEFMAIFAKKDSAKVA